MWHILTSIAPENHVWTFISHIKAVVFLALRLSYELISVDDFPVLAHQQQSVVAEIGFQGRV